MINICSDFTVVSFPTTGTNPRDCSAIAGQMLGASKSLDITNLQRNRYCQDIPDSGRLLISCIIGVSLTTSRICFSIFRFVR